MFSLPLGVCMAVAGQLFIFIVIILLLYVLRSVVPSESDGTLSWSEIPLLLWARKLCSREHATDLYTERGESSAHPHTSLTSGVVPAGCVNLLCALNSLQRDRVTMDSLEIQYENLLSNPHVFTICDHISAVDGYTSRN
jgi:hypothetical protein